MKISVKINGAILERDFSEAAINREMSKLLSQHAVVCNGCSLRETCENYHLKDDNITRGIHVENFGYYPFACTDFQGPTDEMILAKYSNLASISDPAAVEYVRSLR